MKPSFLLGIIFSCSIVSFSQNGAYLPERKFIPEINYFDNGSHRSFNVPFIKTDSIIFVSIIPGAKSSKVVVDYNNDGKIAAYTTLSFRDSGWENSSRDTLFYDSEDKLIRILDLSWTGEKWDSSFQTSNFYEEDRLSSSLHQLYNQNAWINFFRDNYEYTDQGYVKTQLNEIWLNDQWENLRFSTYFYSGSEFRDSILSEVWENGQWVKDIKSLFYYSSNNIDVDSIYAKIWNGTSWDNLFRAYIVNDNNHNQIEQIFQNWDGNAFYNTEKDLYSYNESGYILSGNALQWDSTGNWVQGTGVLRVNNPDGLKIDYITNSVYGYYSNVTGVQDKLDNPEYVLYQNYPNPFNPSTTISYTVPAYSSVTIKIFDILGKEIETLVNEDKPSGTYNFTWNAKGLPSGVYFCRMQAGGYVQTRKMILMY